MDNFYMNDVVDRRVDAFSFYFGNAEDNLFQDACLALNGISPRALKDHPFFSGLQERRINLSALVFLRQVHGILGESIDNDLLLINSFEIEGDFLTTNQIGVGIGVLTADCVPIVIYDPEHRAIAIVHAGWRGTVAEIVQKTVDRMGERYNTHASKIRVLFGPSARSCCYQVTSDFLAGLRPEFVSEAVFHRGNRIFFDVQEYNKQILQTCGVPASAFDDSYARCTMCDSSFWSHRRDGSRGGRQMTVAVMNPLI